jgi:hypothetical protein
MERRNARRQQENRPDTRETKGSTLISPELRVTTYYFVQAMSVGAVNAFAGIWLSSVGISAEQIGFIFAVPIFVVLIINVPVGRVADRARDWRRLSSSCWTEDWNSPSITSATKRVRGASTTASTRRPGRHLTENLRILFERGMADPQTTANPHTGLPDNVSLLYWAVYAGHNSRLDPVNLTRLC